MVTDWQVYVAFRKAQALSKDKPYKLPKDWESFKEKRMTPKNLEFLQEAVMHFNTRLSNIDIAFYMECGFDIKKTFTYKDFLDQRVLNMYIHKDTAQKRKMDNDEQEIRDSFDFLSRTGVPEMAGYNKLQILCKMREGQLRKIVSYYVEGKVDQMTLVYCIWKGYIRINDDERAKLPYIIPRYRELVENMKKMKDILEELEKLL